MAQLIHQPLGSYLDLQIDLLLADSPYHQQALARRLPSRLPELDLELDVLTCEDLILHKLLAGRLLDRSDVVFPPPVEPGDPGLGLSSTLGSAA